MDDKKHDASKSVASGAPKPYVKFGNPSGRFFLAHPVKFLAGNYKQDVIQPGSHDVLGNPGIWANDTDAKGSADWVDDQDAGLFARKLYVVNDALEARGRIGGVSFTFRAVLQIGRKVVVYQLSNSESDEYIVYGFPIDMFGVNELPQKR
jgi:hypothetical protein